MTLIYLAFILLAVFAMAGPSFAVTSTGLVTKGIRSNFYDRLMGTTTLHQRLATRVTSDADKESYKWLGQNPRMRAMGTGILPQGLRSESYDIENMEYEVSIEVDRTEKINDQTGQIMMRAREMGSAAALHKDKLIADLLNAGSDAGSLCYDGLPFFDANHVSGDSGAQSNELTFDISAVMPNEPNTPTAPSPKTLQRLFADMVSALMTFKDDRGEPLDQQPSGLVLCCHPSVWAPWLQALTAQMVENTSNIYSQFRPDVIPMARLTNAAKVFLLKTDVEVRPFIDQHREDVRLNQLEEGSEHEVLTGKLLYVARGIYRMAYGKWFHAVSGELV